MQFRNTAKIKGEILYIEQFHGLSAYIVWRKRRLRWIIQFRQWTWASKGHGWIARPHPSAINSIPTSVE